MKKSLYPLNEKQPKRKLSSKAQALFNAKQKRNLYYHLYKESQLAKHKRLYKYWETRVKTLSK